jgi:hypothetical protein
VYRVARVDPDSEQRWTGYAAALRAFSFLSVALLYLLQRLQALLPLSLDRGPVDPGIAFNTAVSFVTKTNWQSYVPETVMGHLVQMAGLTVQNSCRPRSAWPWPAHPGVPGQEARAGRGDRRGDLAAGHADRGAARHRRRAAQPAEPGVRPGAVTACSPR